ncbi:MAG: hypothetical protein EA423_08185 [Phycisphaerales bacterium]|nr:MAG: hypothetical protein EA423_08185 [Phycisphaerales bacterium]
MFYGVLLFIARLRIVLDPTLASTGTVAPVVPALHRHRLPAGTIIEKQFDPDAGDRARVPLAELIGRG